MCHLTGIRRTLGLPVVSITANESNITLAEVETENFRIKEASLVNLLIHKKSSTIPDQTSVTIWKTKRDAQYLKVLFSC